MLTPAPKLPLLVQIVRRETRIDARPQDLDKARGRNARVRSAGPRARRRQIASRFQRRFRQGVRQAMQRTKWQRELVDETGKEIGHLEARICFSEQDLNEWANFAQIAGGFSEYAAQIPSPEVWPIAVLVDLEIYPEFRKRGRGRAALHQFLRDARTKGAKIALLRVGWYGEDSDAGRAWRIAWYAREGFRELENRAPQLLIPFMYRLL